MLNRGAIKFLFLIGCVSDSVIHISHILTAKNRCGTEMLDIALVSGSNDTEEELKNYCS
jgi:hypothetical protein